MVWNIISDFGDQNQSHVIVTGNKVSVDALVMLGDENLY